VRCAEREALAGVQEFRSALRVSQGLAGVQKLIIQNPLIQNPKSLDFLHE
jgi:hypothetical protein